MIYPARYSMTIEQRARFERSFAITMADGTPVDFSGCTVCCELHSPSGRFILEFGFEWVDQLAGQFSISLTPTQTTPLSGAGVWDLFMVDSNGYKDYWLRGPVVIEPGFSNCFDSVE